LYFAHRAFCRLSLIHALEGAALLSLWAVAGAGAGGARARDGRSAGARRSIGGRAAVRRLV